MNSDSARALATVEKVLDVNPIEGADNIERVTVRGWNVIALKDELQVGDPCVYFEIDSMLDVEDPRFAFLKSRGVKTAEGGFTGHVLKTIKLRGTISQGLVLPFNQFPELYGSAVGDNVTDELNVHKWEPPQLYMPFNFGTATKRPQFIPKTDEERIQNVGYLLKHMNYEWTATEKINGTSVSVYYLPHEPEKRFGVCSRNYDLEEDFDNPYWSIAEQYDLHRWMEFEWPNSIVVIQGELYGQKIQGNSLGLPHRRFAAFNLLVDGSYIPMPEWPEWLPQVPTLFMPIPETVEQALEDVNGLKSTINPDRLAEGVVWRRWPMSFKVINNKYLLKYDA